MRRQRSGMVQTEAQYKFVYLALQRHIQAEKLRLREQVGAGPGGAGRGGADGEVERAWGAAATPPGDRRPLVAAPAAGGALLPERGPRVGGRRLQRCPRVVSGAGGVSGVVGERGRAGVPGGGRGRAGRDPARAPTEPCLRPQDPGGPWRRLREPAGPRAVRVPRWGPEPRGRGRARWAGALLGRTVFRAAQTAASPRVSPSPQTLRTRPGRLEMGRGSGETRTPCPFRGSQVTGEREGLRAVVCLPVWEATSHRLHRAVTPCDPVCATCLSCVASLCLT